MKQEIIKGRIDYPTDSEMGQWLLNTVYRSSTEEGVERGFNVLIRLNLADFRISSGGCHTLYLLNREPELTADILCYLYENARDYCQKKSIPDEVLLSHHAKFMQLAKDIGLPDDWADECGFGKHASYERAVMSKDARLYRIWAPTYLVLSATNCAEVDRSRQMWLTLELVRGLGMMVTNDYSDQMSEAAKIYNEFGETKLRKFFIEGSRKDGRIDRTAFNHLVEMFFMTLAIRQKS